LKTKPIVVILLGISRVFKGYKMGIIVGYDLFTNKMLGMLWDMGVSWDVSITIKK